MPGGTDLGAAVMGPFLLQKGETYELRIDDRFAPGDATFVYLSDIDLQCHMLWRHADPKHPGAPPHPAHDPAVAGRHADIVGISPRIPEGRILPGTAADCAPERVREKVAWVREAASAAGRDPGFLLRGSRLEQFEGWAGETGLALAEEEHAFLEASLAEVPGIARAEVAGGGYLNLFLDRGAFARELHGILVASAPVAWGVLREYQRQRILTFLDPERDPLGAGYNIIQSKIAIGSGGLFGKGWTNGSQAQLEFLPERDTDFIFAVMGEELGLLGLLALLALYMFIVARGLYIAIQAHSSYARLLAGSISLTFFVYVFVNTAMVTGLVPVVGIPLPLVSFGGTSMVTLMAGFGILMSIHTHRKLLPQ